jgi:hypothetical protein
MAYKDSRGFHFASKEEARRVKTRNALRAAREYILVLGAFGLLGLGGSTLALWLGDVAVETTTVRPEMQEVNKK